MKTNNLKWIAITLASLLLFQSCKVYHGKTATVDEVVQSQKRVKVNNYSDETYIFKSLQMEDKKLYGITKKNSQTAKKLKEQIVEEKISGKFVKILLPEETIKEFRLQNKTLSAIFTIAIPIVLVLGLVGLFGLGGAYYN